MAQILVIDDDPAIRETLCRVLCREGHSAVEAVDGRVGVERLKEQPADLVITDILMPEQEGLETIMMLRRDYPEVRIIAISGGGRHGFLDILKYAQQFGAAYTLVKPFTPDELLKTVQRALLDEHPAPSEPPSGGVIIQLRPSNSSDTS